jgi:hypothetical protein
MSLGPTYKEKSFKTRPHNIQIKLAVSTAFIGGSAAAVRRYIREKVRAEPKAVVGHDFTGRV